MGDSLEVKVARCETNISNLESWQTDQNGALIRMAKKVDQLQYWIMGTLGVALIQTMILLFKSALK